MKKFRRILFLLTLITPLAIGFSLFFKISSFRSFQIAEYYQFIALFFLYPMLSYGATTALFGFVQNRKKDKDRLLISNFQNFSTVNETNSKTAIVMPIYEEDTEITFTRMHVIYNSLKNKYPNLPVDFFFLSDTRKNQNWIQEEIAYTQICKINQEYSKIHYRRRKQNLNGKSGNLADFCRRWGKQYDYMIVLDADSFLTAELIQKLILLMDQNPKAGIIQTASKLFRPGSIFQKIQNFNSAFFTDMFSAGSYYYQLDSSPYFGHNAIVRIQPFMKYCALPHLPNYGALGGRILSHDTIEAALMKKAGYDVHLAYNLGGSYEECPPSIIDALKRDQRWCQGNLQHIWFLFAKKIPIFNKIQILIGILSYANAFIWALFIFLSVINYLDDSKYLSYSMLPDEFEFFKSQIYDPLYYQLFAISMMLLFLPRVLAYFDNLVSGRYREFGGFFLMTFNFILETLFSILIAPIYMVYHSIFVISTLLNKKISWGPQNRNSDSVYSLSFIVSSFSGITLLGFTLSYITFEYSIAIFFALVPIFIGWLLSIPLAYFTNKHAVKNKKLFSTPEETFPHEELQLLDREKFLFNFKFTEGFEYFFAFIHPSFFRIHKQYLATIRSNPRRNHSLEDRIAELVQLGPGALDDGTLKRILSDRNLVTKVHHRIWSCRLRNSDTYWNQNWESFIPFSYSSASNRLPFKNYMPFVN